MNWGAWQHRSGKPPRVRRWRLPACLPATSPSLHPAPERVRAKCQEEHAAEDCHVSLINVGRQVLATHHSCARAERMAENAAERDTHNVGGCREACKRQREEWVRRHQGNAG